MRNLMAASYTMQFSARRKRWALLYERIYFKTMLELNEKKLNEKRKLLLNIKPQTHDGSFFRRKES